MNKLAYDLYVSNIGVYAHKMSILRYGG